MKKTDIQISNNGKQVYEKNLVDFVKKTVSDYYGLDVSCLELSSRKKEITKIRQVSIYLIMKNCRITSTMLGWFFNKDHATVLYAVKTITGYLDYDKELQKEVKELQALISLKARAILGNYDLSKEFYFIDLNQFNTLKLTEEKAIILTGFTNKEIEEFKKVNNINQDFRLHERMGMYVLDKPIINEDEKESTSGNTEENKKTEGKAL